MGQLYKTLLRIIGMISLWGMLLYGIRYTHEAGRQEEQVILERALKRAAVQCYAIEGRYPPNSAYIQKHYGVIIDEAYYNVYYDVFADNIMPEIQVLERR